MSRATGAVFKYLAVSALSRRWHRWGATPWEAAQPM
jgi:hypothetical protein